MTFRDILNNLIEFTQDFSLAEGIYTVTDKSDVQAASSILRRYYNHVDEHHLDYEHGSANGVNYLIEFSEPIIEEGYMMRHVNESIEKHDQLNPKLWDANNELKPEVREKIEEIVKKFDDNLKENEVELNVKDICIIGSNANYNYTPDSDVDIHIIADTSVYPNQEDLAMKVYLAYKSLFNNKYDPTLNGIEAEVYVEPDEVHANSNGVYSLNSGWLKEPEKVDIPDIDPEHVNELVQPYEDRYNDIIDSSDATLDDVDNLIDDIYLQRQRSIMKDGEFGDGNICFKEFRNRGYLQNLRDLKVELENKEMSLNTFDEGISNLYGLNEEDEVDLIPELKNYLKVGDKFREPITCEVIEITDIDDDIVTYLSTPVDEEPYSVPVPRNILLANIAEYYEPIKEDVNEALSDDEFAKALEVNSDNAHYESDELGASFDQELSRLGVNAEDYDNYLDMYKRLDAKGKNVISDKIKSFEESLTEDITEYPNGLEFSFSDPVSTLEVYLQWEGIIGYDWQIIEAYEDGGYDGLSEYLDEEGIYGYTEHIRDILEGEPAYCSQMEMEDFESICRHLYISPEDAIAESVCRNVNESDEYSKLKELAIKNKGGLAGNINYCLDKIEDALDAGKINPAEASELNRILTECDLSEAFRVGDRFKSPFNGVTVQLTKVDSDGDYAEYKEVGVDNPVIASTGHEGIANFFDGWKKVKYAPYPKNSPEYIKYNDFDEKIFEVWKNHEGVDAANEILAKAKEARDSGEIAPGHYGLLVQERNYLWNIFEDLEEDDFIECERVSEALNEAASNLVYVELKDDPGTFINKQIYDADDSDFLFTKDDEFKALFDSLTWKDDLQELLDKYADGYSIDDFNVYKHFDEALDESYEVPDSEYEDYKDWLIKVDKRINRDNVDEYASAGEFKYTWKEMQERKKVKEDAEKLAFESLDEESVNEETKNFEDVKSGQRFVSQEIDGILVVDGPTGRDDSIRYHYEDNDGNMIDGPFTVDNYLMLNNYLISRNFKKLLPHNEDLNEDVDGVYTLVLGHGDDEWDDGYESFRGHLDTLLKYADKEGYYFDKNDLQRLQSGKEASIDSDDNMGYITSNDEGGVDLDSPDNDYLFMNRTQLLDELRRAFLADEEEKWHNVYDLLKYNFMGFGDDRNELRKFLRNLKKEKANGITEEVADDFNYQDSRNYRGHDSNYSRDHRPKFKVTLLNGKTSIVRGYDSVEDVKRSFPCRDAELVEEDFPSDDISLAEAWYSPMDYANYFHEHPALEQRIHKLVVELDHHDEDFYRKVLNSLDDLNDEDRDFDESLEEGTSFDGMPGYMTPEDIRAKKLADKEKADAEKAELKAKKAAERKEKAKAERANQKRIDQREKVNNISYDSLADMAGLDEDNNDLTKDELLAVLRSNMSDEEILKMHRKMFENDQNKEQQKKLELDESDAGDPKAVALASFLGVDVSELDDGYEAGSFGLGNEDYYVFTENEAHDKAVESIKDIFDDLGLDAFTPNFQEEILRNCIDESEVEQFVNDELDYFKTQEPDEDMVNYLENLTDDLQYVKDTLGPDAFNDWAKDKIDLDAMAEEAIKADGVAHFISYYDGEEQDLGNGLYAYRIN